MKSHSLIGNNTITIVPKGKRIEYPFVPDPELMTKTGKSKIFTTDSSDPVMTNPIEYKD